MVVYTCWTVCSGGGTLTHTLRVIQRDAWSGAAVGRATTSRLLAAARGPVIKHLTSRVWTIDSVWLAPPTHSPSLVLDHYRFITLFWKHGHQHHREGPAIPTPDANKHCLFFVIFHPVAVDIPVCIYPYLFLSLSRYYLLVLANKPYSFLSIRRWTVLLF